MARDDAPPFARGETFYNGGVIDATDNSTLGGVNLEGKEYVFEPNSQDNQATYPAPSEETGRAVRVRVVRNVSGVALKGGRLAHYKQDAAVPLETRVDGYTIVEADRPAGVVDEFLPAAGVPNNDLFYIVVDGPSKFTNTATGTTFAVGDRVVPAAAGATAGDDLGGRVAVQSLAGATAVLGAQIQNQVGYSDAVNAAVNNGLFKGVVHIGR